MVYASNYKCDKISGKVKHELRAANYELIYTNYEFRFTSYKFTFTSYELKSMIYEFKGYLRYKTIASQNVSSEAQIKNFFISQKNYVPFSRYSSFCIFNHPMIYQICDVMMSFWQDAFLNISFEPQLMKSPNLASW